METAIIVALITALAGILGIIINAVMTPKKKDELLEEEFEEIVNTDGSRSKKEKRRYK